MRNTISNSDKIFIAGANGMVGSAIKRSLLKYVRSNYLSIDILSPSKLELNLLDKEEVNKWFIKNKPSIVILAAAKVGGILANSKYPADFLLNNLLIETNVIESAWRHDVKRLVFLEAVAFILNLRPSQSERNFYLMAILRVLTSATQLQRLPVSNFANP